MTADPTRTPELEAALSALQDDYTYRVNMLLDEGRDDLAADLADDYVSEAAILTARHAA